VIQYTGITIRRIQVLSQTKTFDGKTLMLVVSENKSTHYSC